MKPMKVETCPTCRWKTIRRATCRDCESWDVGPYPRCLCGKSGKRLCKEFRPLPEVEIVKAENAEDESSAGSEK